MIPWTKKCRSVWRWNREYSPPFCGGCFYCLTVRYQLLFFHFVARNISIVYSDFSQYATVGISGKKNLLPCLSKHFAAPRKTSTEAVCHEEKGPTNIEEKGREKASFSVSSSCLLVGGMGKEKCILSLSDGRRKEEDNSPNKTKHMSWLYFAPLSLLLQRREP